MNSQDDNDNEAMAMIMMMIMRQMFTLHIRSNKLLRTFHCCTIDVKLELFRSYVWLLIRLIVVY